MRVMRLERAFLSIALVAASCSSPPRLRLPQTILRSPPAPRAIPSAGDATSVLLPPGVTPVSYLLDLEIDPRKPTFQGRAEIGVTLDAPTSIVVLHGRDLDIHAASIVLSSGSAIAATTSRRKAFGQKEGEDELVLVFESEVPAGPATIDISYQAPFGTLWGLYRAKAGGSFYAFTQLEAIDARRMFPCFDEPRFKTPFEITIHTPEGMTAVSNAPLVRAEPEPGGTRFVFQKTKPLPTYLVATAVGDLDILDGPTTPVPIRLVATKGRAKLGKDSTNAASALLGALEKYFGIPYAYGKLDIVAVPDFAPGAMENAGLVTFREDILLSDGKAPASARRRNRYVIAHEFAHQWFGDLVTMRWWDDLWLNEGFATWMQGKACDAAYPGFGGIDERVLDKNLAMTADVLPSARAVRPPITRSDEIYDAGGWSAYQKGASVLAMAEAWVGEDEFRTGITAYLSSHAYGPVTSPELFAALDEHAKKPIAKIIAGFLDQPGVPYVSLDVDCASTKPAARIRLTEAQLTESGADRSDARRRWSTPVCVRVEGEKQPLCTVLDDTASIELSRCPKWVLPNADEAGYYRYGLGPEWLKRVVRSGSALTIKERAGLLENTWATAPLGTLDVAPATVLDVLDGLDIPHEESRVLLQATVDVLTEMRRILGEDAGKPPFIRFVHRLLDAQRKALALPKPDAVDSDDMRLKRVLVWGAIYDLTEDTKVAADLEPIAQRYVDDPTSVDADLGPLALRVSARAGGAAGTRLDGARLLAAKTPAERVAITVALASKKDPAALRVSLDLFLTGEIPAGDIRHVKNGALRNADTTAVFHRWMREHFDELVKKLGTAGALSSTVGRVCDAEHLADLASFFEPRLPSLTGAARGYEEGVADAKRCIATRARAAHELAAGFESRK